MTNGVGQRAGRPSAARERYGSKKRLRSGDSIGARAIRISPRKRAVRRRRLLLACFHALTVLGPVGKHVRASSR